MEICRGNLKALSRAMSLYLADNEQTFPPAEVWYDRLLPYLPDADALQCPSGRRYQCGYAFSAALGGMKPDVLTESWHTVMFYESDGGWNAAGGPELLPDQPRHFGGDNYGFADGHAQWFARKRLPDGTRAKEARDDGVIWDPKVKAKTPVKEAGEKGAGEK
jgi:prepilin-type processing-associated H-X9-DG protein